jgi:CRP-like cAMP-binding protein
LEFCSLVAGLQFFQNLTSKLQKLVCRQLRSLDLTAGDNVFKQGDEGWEFFILLRGEVDVFIDGHKVVSLQEGAAFGELALLDDGEKRRTAMVSCKGQCFFGVLDKKDYNAVLRQDGEHGLAHVTDLLADAGLLRPPGAAAGAAEGHGGDLSHLRSR